MGFKLIPTALLVGFLAIPASAQDLRVYVFSAATDHEDADTTSAQDLQETVADVVKSLERKQGLVLAEDASTADFTVEVLGRELTVTPGETVRLPPPGMRSEAAIFREPGSAFTENPDREISIRARLRFGNQERELVAQNRLGSLVRTERWPDLARRLGDQIDKWARENRGALLVGPALEQRLRTPKYEPGRH